MRLKGRSTATGPLYSAVLADNGPLPQTGSDNAGTGVLNEIDTLLNNSLKRTAIPGVLLAVAVDGRLVHARGYGYSDMMSVMNLIQQSEQSGGPSWPTANP